MIVAIDGPAGSGKSTTARAVASRLGFLYLDTGAMYRAVALAYLERGAPLEEMDAEVVLAGLRIDLRHSECGQRVFLNDRDVSDRIRRAEVGEAASRVATWPAVREKMVDEQRRIARAYEHAGGGVVVDGRDIGTVVFPDAEVKVFMSAAPEVRAVRRLEEMQGRGETSSLEVVLAEIRRRDAQDTGRAVGPLRRADDAVEIDTSACSFDEQVATVVRLVEERESGSTV